MERSDWSRAFHHQGRHGIIPYYRSNEEILGKHLIGREQFHHQGRHMSSPIIAPDALFYGNIVARGATVQLCRRF